MDVGVVNKGPWTIAATMELGYGGGSYPAGEPEMKTTIDFLNDLRAAHGLTSDYQLAKLFGCRQQTISNYRTGKTAFDEAAAVRVAELLNVRPAYVLACVAAERSKNAPARAAWTEAAEALCIM
jgi:hypothetical protein